MNTKTLDRIRNLNRAAANLSGFFDKFDEMSKQPNCDKKGNGFGADNRFAAFSVNTSFDSWTGHYGNSGCSAVLHVDQDIAREFLIKALNEHKKAIFVTMARLMTEEAKTMTDKAKAEIADMQKMVDELAA